MNTYSEKYSSVIESRLKEIIDSFMAGLDPDAAACAEAMGYSLCGGGKRIRPMLVCEFCRMLSGSFDAAIDAACALEMVHTFSLIHDDLPCMDNDDLRRGRPCCHKVYGEAVALLAGDGLENHAFEVIAASGGLSDEKKVKLIAILSRAVGLRGMTGGQAMDIRNTGRSLDGRKLLDMYSMKTGALIRAACEMGCVCAGREDMLPDAQDYADALGLAFQIVDDILDIIADENVLGKNVGSDENLNKATYPAVFGLDAAKEKAAELTENAVKAAEKFPDSDFLIDLTKHLLDRNS